LSGAAKITTSISRRHLLEIQPFAVARRVRGGGGEETASREPLIVDHGRAGVGGFFSVVGGAVVEHRWTAQRVTDRIATWLARDSKCRSDAQPLPGAEGPTSARQWAEQFSLSEDIVARLVAKHGARAHDVLKRCEEPSASQLVCRCRGITQGEIAYVARDESAIDVEDVARRTGLGHGICQGSRCHLRAAQIVCACHRIPDAELLRRVHQVKQARFERYRQCVAHPQSARFAIDRLAHLATANFDQVWANSNCEPTTCE
jgi:glycerol-3-phosphate dehydrogenase